MNVHDLSPRNSLLRTCLCGHAKYQHAVFSWATVCFECEREARARNEAAHRI